MAGAFGTVYRARLDHVLPVAVKMLKPDFFKDKDQDERDKIIQSFVNEVHELDTARVSCARNSSFPACVRALVNPSCAHELHLMMVTC